MHLLNLAYPKYVWSTRVYLFWTWIYVLSYSFLLILYRTNSPLYNYATPFTLVIEEPTYYKKLLPIEKVLSTTTLFLLKTLKISKMDLCYLNTNAESKNIAIYNLATADHQKPSTNNTDNFTVTIRIFQPFRNNNTAIRLQKNIYLLKCVM